MYLFSGYCFKSPKFYFLPFPQVIQQKTSFCQQVPYPYDIVTQQWVFRQSVHNLSTIITVVANLSERQLHSEELFEKYVNQKMHDDHVDLLVP